MVFTIYTHNLSGVNFQILGTTAVLFLCVETGGSKVAQLVDSCVHIVVYLSASSSSFAGGRATADATGRTLVGVAHGPARPDGPPNHVVFIALASPGSQCYFTGPPGAVDLAEPIGSPFSQWH
jgi:hypothetical protein